MNKTRTAHHMGLMYASQGRALRAIREGLWVYFNSIDQENPLVQPISKAFNRATTAVDDGAIAMRALPKHDRVLPYAPAAEGRGRLQALHEVLSVAAGSCHAARFTTAETFGALFKPGAAGLLRDLVDEAASLLADDVTSTYVELRQPEISALIANLEQLAKQHQTQPEMA